MQDCAEELKEEPRYGGFATITRWSELKVAQSCPTLCDPLELYTPRNFPSQNTGVGSLSLLQGIFLTQGLNPPTLQADSLLAEPPEKPKNTGVSSLSLLQQIFLTQKLNQGLLYCRQILYQLSYQGSLKLKVKVTQSCPTLCDPMDYPAHGILQASILE